MSEDTPAARQARTLDFAVVLTLGTAALYFLAWSYWDGYLSYFGAGNDFLELRIENVIAPVWKIALLYAAFIVMMLGPTLDAPRGQTASVPLIAIIGLGCLVVFQFVPSGIPKWVGITCAVAMVIAMFLARNTAISVASIVRGRHGVLTWAWLLLFVIANVFGHNGAREAERLATGKNSERVRVETRSDMGLPSDLVLVAHAGSRYLFCEPKKPNPKPEAIVIEASDILKLTTYKKQ